MPVPPPPVLLPVPAPPVVLVAPVPPPVAPVPPVALEPLELEPEEDELLDELLGEVVVGVVDVEVVPVLDELEPETEPLLPVGTVSGGAPEVSPEALPLLPQALTPSDSAAPAASAATIAAGRRLLGTAMTFQPPSGSIRRPQWGQSFRSFCVS